jgi:hypothetical protein
MEVADSMSSWTESAAKEGKIALISLLSNGDGKAHPLGRLNCSKTQSMRNLS